MGGGDVFTGVCLSACLYPCSFLVAGPMSLSSLWSQVSSRGNTPVRVEGYPSPSQGVPQFQPGGYPILSRLGYTTPRPQLGLGYPPAGPATNRIRCGRYASCVFTQEDFLVLNLKTRRICKDWGLAKRKVESYMDWILRWLWNQTIKHCECIKLTLTNPGPSGNGGNFIQNGEILSRPRKTLGGKTQAT